ncbi:hypothetical protein PV721_27470 [Streptomyces sp. MB09-01]|uniref:transposase n=1 Tax=Streptomyces sp. MB09-01 TaxID=3028666 RepID=UPI0029AED289|nr:transposase [Streptomyces sp. MB09-01]MDX3538023.1 hypothetical protein [Streptomyces sp. MB09-01]
MIGCAALAVFASLPDETAFATKPQLAGDMLEDAHASGIRTAWVAADKVYGGRELRCRIRTLGPGYAIAVPTSHRVTTPSGKAKVTALLERVLKRAGMRLKTGNGTKGERLYDWAMIDVTPDDTPPGHPDGHSQVLIRLHRRTGALSFYRTWHPDPQPLSVRVSVGCRRWRVEEDFQGAMGLAHLDTGRSPAGPPIRTTRGLDGKPGQNDLTPSWIESTSAALSSGVPTVTWMPLAMASRS